MIIPLTRTPSRISYSSRLYNVPPFLLPCRKLGRNEEEMLPSPMLGMMARKGKGGGGRLRNEEQKMALWLRREQCLLLWNYTPLMPLLMRDRGRRYGRRSSRLSYDSASFVTSFLPSFPCLAFEPPRRHNAPWLIPRATGFQYSNGGASHHLLSLSLPISSSHPLVQLVYLCGGYTLDAGSVFHRASGILIRGFTGARGVIRGPSHVRIYTRPRVIRN